MPTPRYSTAGESHGACLIIQIDGLPAGFEIPVDLTNAMLLRRQGGYGRGGRMKIETDTIEILTGILRGRTIGSPLALKIANRDHRIDEAPAVHRPRPGHADLAGAYKWDTDDCRPVLERASARETASRTAAVTNRAPGADLSTSDQPSPEGGATSMPATCAPARAQRSAQAAPMPEAAPVIRTALPSRRPTSQPSPRPAPRT